MRAWADQLWSICILGQGWVVIADLSFGRTIDLIHIAGEKQKYWGGTGVIILREGSEGLGIPDGALVYLKTSRDDEVGCILNGSLEQVMHNGHDHLITICLNAGDEWDGATDRLSCTLYEAASRDWIANEEAAGQYLNGFSSMSTVPF